MQVNSLEQLHGRQLRLNVTTNMGVDVPEDADAEAIERAFAVAQLSKDDGIRDLAWQHTRDALGGENVTTFLEDTVRTEQLSPTPPGRPIWPAVVLPIIAGAPPELRRTRNWGYCTALHCAAAAQACASSAAPRHWMACSATVRAAHSVHSLGPRVSTSWSPRTTIYKVVKSRQDH